MLIEPLWLGYARASQGFWGFTCLVEVGISVYKIISLSVIGRRNRV